MCLLECLFHGFCDCQHDIHDMLINFWWISKARKGEVGRCCHRKIMKIGDPIFSKASLRLQKLLLTSAVPLTALVLILVACLALCFDALCVCCPCTPTTKFLTMASNSAIRPELCLHLHHIQDLWTLHVEAGSGRADLRRRTPTPTPFGKQLVLPVLHHKYSCASSEWDLGCICHATYLSWLQMLSFVLASLLLPLETLLLWSWTSS